MLPSMRRMVLCGAGFMASISTNSSVYDEYCPSLITDIIFAPVSTRVPPKVPYSVCNLL